MDLIDKAIKNGLHKVDISLKNQQTWETFQECTKGKKVFIFGLGKATQHYLSNYKDKFLFEKAFDNAPELQGYVMDDFMEIIGEGNKQVSISCPEDIMNYNPEEVVVFITITNGYDTIVRWLVEHGIDNCFVYLLLEVNRRMSKNVKTIKTNDASVEKYIKEALSSPICQKKVLFYTMGTYSGHGKYIVEQLVKYRNDLDIVWVVKDIHVKVPSFVRKVCVANRRKHIYEMETAAFWVYDDMITFPWVIKRTGQKYIQIKHWASITLKSFGFDLTTFRNEKDDITICEYNSRMLDYIITGSDFDTRTCRRGFRFDGPIVQLGSARTDALFKAEVYKEKICKECEISRDKKILLYAPTFRCEKDVYYHPIAACIDLEFEEIKNTLEDKFGGEWCILLRLHPVVAKTAKEIHLPEFVINVSDYDDSQELVAASDVMITDYSSIMFEPAFVRKPVFLLATDWKEYINGERPLLIDYRSLPFPIADSNAALIKNIIEFEKKKYIDSVDAFLKKYNVCEDGHASERIANFLLDLIDNVVI